MTTVVLKTESFHWLDLIDPSAAELDRVASDYGLHTTSIQDCLDPSHLPKFEQIGAVRFLILRGHDDHCPPEADTVRELTRKVAMFYSDRFLITVHRKDQPFLAELRERWANSADVQGNIAYSLLHDLVFSSIRTYSAPIARAQDSLERMEMGVFEAEGAAPFVVKDAYFLKRKAAVFRRMLRSALEFIPRIFAESDTPAPRIQDLREAAETLAFYSDELLESVTSLLNLHLSLASNRTNEVMRVLTVLSVFLLPLNVITGIYGMNFEHMPELKWHYGYPGALLLMAAVLGTVSFWVRRRGWL